MYAFEAGDLERLNRFYGSKGIAQTPVR